MVDPGAGPAGESLVFLVSQPRAGSTLLQRTLGRHPLIQTRSEPWLMLQPIYALRAEGWESEYRADIGRRAVEDFLSALPGGREEYHEGLRRMYGYLYQRALELSGRRLFLDKTPRYYLILPELIRTFPAAAYIVLLRHPAAVLDSIARARIFGSDRARRLRNHAIDLVRGPRLLAEAVEEPPGRLLSVRFERLVTAPREVLGSVCDHLGIEFTEELLRPPEDGVEPWMLGEKGEMPLSSPDPAAAERWLDGLRQPQRWRDSRDYLELIGDDLVERLGYDASEWRDRLAAHRPSWLRLARTTALERELGDHGAAPHSRNRRRALAGRTAGPRRR